MTRYEIIKWDGGYNIADNNFLNAVVFDHSLSYEEAVLELEKLNATR